MARPYYLNDEIIDALKKGDRPLLEQMRAQNIDFFAVPGSMHAAAQAGCAQSVQFLIDCGFSASDDFSAPQRGLLPTSLFAAVEGNHPECVQLLLPHVNAWETNGFGWSAQAFAAHKGFVDCLRVLTPQLNPDFPPNEASRASWVNASLSAACKAAARAGEVGALRLLSPFFNTVVFSPFPDFGDDPQHDNPLANAASANQPEAAAFLLGHFDAAATCDRQENTALHLAAICGAGAEMFAVLLPRSDANQRNSNGARALDLAVGHESLEAVKALAPATRVEAFCARSGSTVLGEAAEYGNAQILQALLPHCDPDATDEKSRTPLMRAVLSERAACAEALAPRSNLALKNSMNQTAADLAVHSLLESSIDPLAVAQMVDAIASILPQPEFCDIFSQRLSLADYSDLLPRCRARQESIELREMAGLGPNSAGSPTEPAARANEPRRRL